MTQSRKTLASLVAVLTACTLISATAVVASAAKKPRKTGIATQAVDHQKILWRTGKSHRAFTTSEKWAQLDMPAGGCVVRSKACSHTEPTPFMIAAKGEISLTFSGNFSRAPVEFRFRDGGAGGRIMKPGVAKFHPHAHGNSFSFTFVSPRKSERICEGPYLQWRSPTGDEVRLNKATIVVHYKKFTTDEPVGCA